MLEDDGAAEELELSLFAAPASEAGADEPDFGAGAASVRGAEPASLFGAELVDDVEPLEDELELVDRVVGAGTGVGATVGVGVGTVATVDATLETVLATVCVTVCVTFAIGGLTVSAVALPAACSKT